MASKRKTMWVLVADGVHGQLYEMESLPLRLKALPAGHFEGVNKRTRDLESDRPGVSFESVGGMRHAIQRRSDAHRREEEKFVRSVASAIKAYGVKKAFDELIVVAPPRALATLRTSLDVAVKKKVKHQIRGEWTSLGIKEIESHLAAHLGIGK